MVYLKSANRNTEIMSPKRRRPRRRWRGSSRN